MAKGKTINAAGNLVSGVAVSPIKIQGAASLNQLRNAGLMQPSFLDEITQRRMRSLDAKEREAYDARENVQRPFDASRKRRAKEYARYIANVEFADGSDHAYGGVPAITLYCAMRCEEDQDVEGIRIPFKAVLVAIDGETQTEARFLLAEERPETGDLPLAFTLYHDIHHDHAKQILTDYNTLGQRISLKKTLAMNSTGPLTRAVVEAATLVNVDPNKINGVGDTGTTRHLASFTQMFNGMAGAAAPDLALKGQLTKITASMNKPFGKPVESKIIAVGAALLKECEDQQSAARRAPVIVWQAAGYIINEKGPPRGRSLNWQAATDMVRAMKKEGRPLPEKLRSVANVL